MDKVESEEIKQLLPKYLSPESSEKLFAALDQFPDNINDILYGYSSVNDPDVFQGDGLNNLLITNLPDPSIKEGPVMVLSNTCDTSLENERAYRPKLIYCPIIRLSSYINWLKIERGLEGERLDTHIYAIKHQEISTFFFLPSGAGLKEDCIAMLDRVCNCRSSYLQRLDIKFEFRLTGLPHGSRES